MLISSWLKMKIWILTFDILVQLQQIHDQWLWSHQMDSLSFRHLWVLLLYCFLWFLHPLQLIWLEISKIRKRNVKLLNVTFIVRLRNPQPDHLNAERRTWQFYLIFFAFSYSTQWNWFNSLTWCDKVFIYLFLNTCSSHQRILCSGFFIFHILEFMFWSD